MAASVSRPVELVTAIAAAHASLAYGLMAFNHDADGDIREYRLAIAAKPDWLPAHRSLGALLFTLHRYDDALVEFRAVAALAPDDTAA